MDGSLTYYLMCRLMLQGKHPKSSFHPRRKCDIVWTDRKTQKILLKVNELGPMQMCLLSEQHFTKFVEMPTANSFESGGFFGWGQDKKPLRFNRKTLACNFSPPGKKLDCLYSRVSFRTNETNDLISA